MKKMILTLGLSFLGATLANAQTGTDSPASHHFETQSSVISSVLVEPTNQQRPKQELPDAPIPILPQKQDGPMPCPGGVGAPCALLGGRLYFSDPSHMTQHDRTWFDALKNPMILGGIFVNEAALAWDYRTTRACIDRHRCKEGNPIMGQTRAQELGVGLSLNAFQIYNSARLKQHGKGNAAFFFLATGAIFHTLAAAHNRSL